MTKKKHSNTLKWKCTFPDIRKKLVEHLRLQPNKLREPCNTGRDRHIYLQEPRVVLEIKTFSYFRNSKPGQYSQYSDWTEV